MSRGKLTFREPSFLHEQRTAFTPQHIAAVFLQVERQRVELRQSGGDREGEPALAEQGIEVVTVAAQSAAGDFEIFEDCLQLCLC